MTQFGTSPAIQKSHIQKTHVFVDAVVFNEAAEAYTSEKLDVSDYRDFAVLLDLAVALAPTDILISVEFSDDCTTYYRLVNGPFGDLRYEDTAGAKKEAIIGKVIASYMRIHVLSTGCNATNTFTLTAKVVLS